MRRIIPFLLVGAIAFMVGSFAYAGDMAKSGAKGAAKSTFLVMWAHTPEECLASMDKLNAKGAKELAMWDFGCKAGDHTAYMMTKASSEDAVKAMLPEEARDVAKIVKLTKFTAEDIRMAHQEMDKH